MKIQKRYLLSFIFVATSFVGLQAQTEQVVVDTLATDTVVVLPWPQNVQARLDTLMLDPLLESTQLGLMVYDLTADSLLYSHGAKQTLRPASTMKLLTAVTAIDLLGGDYKLNTSLRYKGTVKDSVLTGDLICVGSLDPMFDANDMRAFVESVKGLGVDTIRGRLVAAPSFKEEELFGEGWCWDDENPQLSSLLVERKDEFMMVLANKLRDVLHFKMTHSTRRYGGCSNANTAGFAGLTLIARNHVFINGNICCYKSFLCNFSRQIRIFVAEVNQHRMVVSTT